jgi:hypothetical protein
LRRTAQIVVSGLDVLAARLLETNAREARGTLEILHHA